MIIRTNALYVRTGCIEFAGQKFVENDIVNIRYEYKNRVFEIDGRISDLYDDMLALDASRQYHRNITILLYKQIISISRL